MLAEQPQSAVLEEEDVRVQAIHSRQGQSESSFSNHIFSLVNNTSRLSK